MSLFKERILSLHTNLGVRIAGKSQSLLVTSAGWQEGKSTVAANLSLIVSKRGERVLLIDADMRRPSLNRIFGKGECAGLTDLAKNGFEDGSTEKSVQQIAPNLFLLSRGLKPAEDPGTLFSSPDFIRWVHTLKGRYSRIILDSSPVLVAAEVTILAALIESVLLVLGAGMVTREEAQRAKKCLESSGSCIIGTVVNNYDKRHIANDRSYEGSIGFSK